MSNNKTSILNEYLTAFDDPYKSFIYYYSFDNNNEIIRKEFSRGEFLSLAKRAADVIHKTGLNNRDSFALCFGKNHYYDLVFRLASIMTGTVPVTINWQADTLERIFYKIELTQSKFVATHPSFNPEYLKSIKERFQDIEIFNSEILNEQPEIDETTVFHDLDPEDTRINIFTSGTTGQPKGVLLPYRAYEVNRATFEKFLGVSPIDKLTVLIVNPLHHANSTAITDWAMRRSDTHIHLIEKYSTNYWKILAEAVSKNYERIVAPVVSRHFDFLENLVNEKSLPIPMEDLKIAMKKIDFLIGSAPVGPSTINMLKDFTGCIPNVRFGSTETCLQVIGIPRHLSDECKFETFHRGWKHVIDGEPMPGYYIGRPHPPYTEAQIVQSLDRCHEHYMKQCSIGQPGYLVTRGRNVMTGYVNKPEETGNVFVDDWYTGLYDICFALQNSHDGELDYYWVGREQELMIRGGANYAYDQINCELTNFAVSHYNISKDSLDIAVVGLKVDSDHEDACCVTIEICNDCNNKAIEIQKTFKSEALKHVSKGAKPDYVHFAKIPRNFKGAIQIKELTAEFKKYIQTVKDDITSPLDSDS